jgi:transposase-like protein
MDDAEAGGGGGGVQDRNEKEQARDEPVAYRSGIRVCRFDPRLSTLHLVIRKLRKGGYMPFLVTERKRSELAPVEVVQ